MESKAEIDVDNLKKKITELSNTLNKLGAEQENTHKEKKTIDARLSELIRQAKELKKQKQDLVSEIKSKKETRSKLNRELAQAFRSAVKKDLNIDLQKINKQIEAMQYAIEVEGIPFEKEKLYMERIKQLKQKIAEAEAINKSNKELQEKKARADQVHSEIQSLVSKNNEIFAELTKKAQEIKELKEKRKLLQEKIKKIRKDMDDVNSTLSQTLAEWLSILEKQKEEAAPEISTKDLLKQFKEKKLTKEDLFKLQRTIAKNGNN
jgi:uncharacterized coiled-coil DUF342 family protein